LRDKEFACRKHGTTSLGGRCKTCPDFKADPEAGVVQPTRVIRFDHHNLCPGAPGVRFNPSLIESGDGYLLAWRHGWQGCQIFACRLDREFRPTTPAKQLDLYQKGANLGREDPRWFRHKDGLHLMYTGVSARRRQVFTNVCFARVNEDTLATEDRFLPEYAGRNQWEKNWTFFDHGKELYAVYTISPHRVLKIESNHARLLFETPWEHRWSGGELRGGASPVLHHGEWYSFFHGLVTRNGRRRYNVGVYTFRAAPPFDVLRYTPHPIELARLTDVHDNYCEVTFPGGAVHVGGQWVIAVGMHDRWSEIHCFDAAEIERRLVRV
jgi:predicted GH43/DUF377 family glycosyl hydrolase